MKGDFTRNTFDRAKHYSGVRMQQGRVQLDADWNEQLDIQAHRDRTTHRDVIGYCGGPRGTDATGHELAGFRITPAGTDLTIGRGRYYVSGILVENEAKVRLTEQPDLPDYDPRPAMAEDPGVYLVYLDVWERHITALEDPEIREVALGGPDTATRTQVVWQVRLIKVGEPGEAVDCSDFGPGWRPAESSGRLAARARESGQSRDLCSVPARAGYRRLENQLYRVEIHTGGGVGEATFKWSRENGSIVTRWEDQDGDHLTVTSLGRDPLLGFADGDWVELTDDTRELHGRPGVLVRLKKAEGNVLTIDPSTIQDPDDPSATGVDRADFPRNPKIRRWESQGAETVTIPAGNDGWIELEDGVWIRFQAGGVYRSGDYWTIPARTALGDVLWDEDPDDPGRPAFQLRHGTEHFYCPLAIGEFTPDGWGELTDCRRTFPPLTGLPTGDRDCCTVTVGDGVLSVGDFRSIQAAVDALDPERGGTVCILPGEYHLQEPVQVALPHITLRGCGGRSRIRAGQGIPAFVIRDGRRGVHLADLAIRAESPRGAVRIQASVDVQVSGCLIVNRRRGEPPAQPAFEARLPHLSLEHPPLAGVPVPEERRRVLKRPPVGPALWIQGCREVHIQANVLLGLPALSIQAREAVVRDNRLFGGGLWLWDGSSHARVEDNEISRGEGPGVVLGGLPPGEKPAREAAGVTRVLVQGNHIRGMGGSGISSVVDVEENLELGELEDVTIARNRIEGCGLDGLDPVYEPLAVGGVVLRSVTGLRIHDNVIAENRPEAGGPAVGIFLHTCLGLEVADNRILDNGSAEEAARCADFQGQEPGATGPNPRTEADMRFTVSDFQGHPPEQTRIKRAGDFTGLDAGRTTRVQLPEPVSRATVTLVTFASPGSVVARNAAGNEVDKAGMRGEPGVAETLTLSGEKMVELEVQAPQGELLILRVCAGQRAGGFQAGLVAWYVLGGTFQAAVPGAPVTGFQRNTPAAVIRDNHIATPRGQALILVGMGAVSVAGNSLTSHGLHAQPVVSGPEGEPDQLDRIAQLGRCVSIYNLGRTPVLSEATLGFCTGAVTHLSAVAAPTPVLPDGPVLFHGNQIRLEIPQALRQQNMASVVLASFDDVSVQGNQVAAGTPRTVLLVDLLAAAPTARVSGNRFTELPHRALLSCWSIGVQLNVTSDNQATHCIRAQGGAVVNRDNQVLVTTNCERLSAGTGFTTRPGR